MPQDGSTPLHLVANGGHPAIVELLLAAGAAVDAGDKVRGVGSAGRGWLGAERSSACLLIFLFCAARNLVLRSLPGLLRRLVTLLRCKHGNVADSPANHLNEI